MPDAGSEAGLDAGAQIQVITNLGNPTGVAITGGTLFWTDALAGTLSTCDPTNCASPTVLLSNLTGPQTVATDGASLFWASNVAGGGLYSVTISACLTSPTACLGSEQTIGTAFQYPGDVSVDANNVYFTAIDTFAPSDGGAQTDSVFVCPKTGCPADGGAPGALATGLDLAPTPTFVYGTTLYFGQGEVSVESCALPSCASPKSVQGITDPAGGLAVDATGVYWSGPDTGKIYTCGSPTGCGGDSPVVLGSGFGYPNAIAIDVSYVYVSVGDQDDAGLYRGIYRVKK